MADEVQRAGRGGIAIAGAKLYFMVAGLAQQILLTHVLGLQDYGALGRVQSIASVLYNPVISTGVQGVSRSVAGAEEGDRDAAQRRALTIHSLGVLPLAAALLVAAPWITAAIRAPHLTTALRIVAGVLLVYGLYAPLVGAINGRKRFGLQALLDALAATLRTAGLVGGAYLLLGRDQGVEGAFYGFLASVTVMMVVAAFVAGLGRRGAGGSSRRHLLFIAPLFGGQFALNLLFQSDIQLLGRFAADAAAAAGMAVDQADTLAGAYRNAQLFCFLPYQLLLSVTFVLFPLLASAKRDGDREAVATYTQSGVRLSVILTGAMVSVTAGLPKPLLTLVFSRESAELAGTAMGILAVGMGAFAIFGIFASVLTSLGRERISAVLTVVALALVAALCFALVRGQPFGEVMLVRTAIATSAGLWLATLWAGWEVRKTAGAVVPVATLLRCGVALAGAAFLGRMLPAGPKPLTIVYALVVGLAYVLVLTLSREVGAADLARIGRLVGKGRKKSS